MTTKIGPKEQALQALRKMRQARAIIKSTAPELREKVAKIDPKKKKKKSQPT